MPVPRAPRSPHKASETDATIWRMSHTSSSSSTHRYRRGHQEGIHVDNDAEPFHHRDLESPQRAEVHVSASTADPPTIVVLNVSDAPIPAKSQVRIRFEARTTSKDATKRKSNRSTERALSPADRALQRHDATEYTSALHRCEDRLIQEALRAQRQDANLRVQSAQRRREVLSYYAAVSRDNGGFSPQVPEVKKRRVPKPVVLLHRDTPTYRNAQETSSHRSRVSTVNTKSESRSRTVFPISEERTGRSEPKRIYQDLEPEAHNPVESQQPTTKGVSGDSTQSTNTNIFEANMGLNYSAIVAATGCGVHSNDCQQRDATQQPISSHDANTVALPNSRVSSVVSNPPSQHQQCGEPPRMSYGRVPLPMPIWEGGGDGYEHYRPTGLIAKTPIRPSNGALRLDDMLVVRTLRKPLPMPIRDEFTPRAVATGYFDKRQVLSMREVDMYMRYCAKKRWFHYMKVETVASNLRRDRNRRLIHACVREWAEATRRRRHNEDIAAKTRIRSLTQQWRVAAEEKRLTHVADAHHRNHLIRVTMSKWARTLHLAQCGTRHLHERTLLKQRRRVFTMWKEQAVAARYHRVDQLGGAFRRWRQRTVDRTHRLDDGGVDPLLRRSMLEHLTGLRLKRVFGKWKARLRERQIAGVADDQCTFMRKLKCFGRWKHTSQDNKLERLSPTKGKEIP